MQYEPERDRCHGGLSGIHCERLAFRRVRARKHRLTNTIVKDGDTYTATITWSSSNYDKMTVDGVDYAP